jgi:hypothetical protein
MGETRTVSSYPSISTNGHRNDTKQPLTKQPLSHTIKQHNKNNIDIVLLRVHNNLFLGTFVTIVMPTAFQNMSRTIVNNNTVFNGGSPIINQYCSAPSNQTTATQPMQATGTQDHVSGGGANATGSDNGQEDDQPPSISVSAITFDNNGRIRLPHGFLQPLKRANDFDHAKKLMAYYPYFSGDNDLIQKVHRGDKIVWSNDQVKKIPGETAGPVDKNREEGQRNFRGWH